MKSDLEAALLWQITAASLPAPVAEYRFHPPRRFRFDLAWPDAKVAIEIQGGVWSGGRHVRGNGYEVDCEKANLAAMDGWTVLRYTARHIEYGIALSEVEQVLKRQSQAEPTASVLSLTDRLVSSTRRSKASARL